MEICSFLVEQVVGSFEFFRLSQALYLPHHPFLHSVNKQLSQLGTVLGAEDTEMRKTQPCLQSLWGN